MVMDAADATPIANATVLLRHSQGELTTRTDAAGAYTLSFDTSQPFKPTGKDLPGNLLGMLVARDGAYWGDIRSGHWETVQLMFSGTPDVVQNLRLRPVRTLAAGQSMGLLVEPDSSLAWDKEWDPWMFTSFDTLWEEFFVSVQTDGVLTVDARAEAGGHVATLACYYGECRDTVSIPVEASRSPFYFSVKIPRASAPQRYQIHTALR